MLFYNLYQYTKVFQFDMSTLTYYTISLTNTKLVPLPIYTDFAHCAPLLPKQFFCTQDVLVQDLTPKVTFKGIISILWSSFHIFMFFFNQSAHLNKKLTRKIYIQVYLRNKFESSFRYAFFHHSTLFRLSMLLLCLSQHKKRAPKKQWKAFVRTKESVLNK